MSTRDLGLGRIHQPDPRDHAWRLGAPRPEQVDDPNRRVRVWWAGGAWLDQGQTPECTAYGWSHWYYDGPVTHKPGTLPDPGDLYGRLQAVDGIPGAHEGSTVRAGAQVLRGLGRIDSYRWAPDMDTLVAHLLHVGPLVVGTVWLENMFDPARSGLLDVSGPVAGGHAYVLDAINLNTGLVRMKNSWSKRWGRRGFGYLPLADVNTLVFTRGDGEACAAIEHRDAA